MDVGSEAVCKKQTPRHLEIALFYALFSMPFRSLHFNLQRNDV